MDTATHDFTHKIIRNYPHTFEGKVLEKVVVDCPHCPGGKCYGVRVNEGYGDIFPIVLWRSLPKENFDQLKVGDQVPFPNLTEPPPSEQSELQELQRLEQPKPRDF
jgi:hypothetical protein